MSKIFTLETRPYDDRKLFNRKKIEINEGVTVLVGCNGAGKSTVLQYIREQLESRKKKDASFDD